MTGCGLEGIATLKNILHFVLSCSADDPGYFWRDICYTALQVTHKRLCLLGHDVVK